MRPIQVLLRLQEQQFHRVFGEVGGSRMGSDQIKRFGHGRQDREWCMYTIADCYPRCGAAFPGNVVLMGMIRGKCGSGSLLVKHELIWGKSMVLRAQTALLFTSDKSVFTKIEPDSKCACFRAKMVSIPGHLPLLPGPRLIDGRHS